MSSKGVIVIGAGASGCMAALLAAEQGMQVTLIDHMDRIGKKLLVTGNGRCNMTNLSIDLKQYISSSDKKLEYLKQIFQFCDAKKVCSLFEERGLLTKARNELVYPITMQASSVVDFFRNHLENNPCVTLKLQENVKAIHKKGDKLYTVVTDKGKYTSENVLVACGGMSAPKTGSDGSGFGIVRDMGIRMQNTYPALVQLVCAGNMWKAMSGVRSDAVITLNQLSERGELQITDYGISGIAVFQLSLHLAAKIAGGKVSGSIDFMPDMSEDKLFLAYKACQKQYMGHAVTMPEAFGGILQKKIMLQVMKLIGIKGDTSVDLADDSILRKICHITKEFPVTVTGSKGFESAQVTSGGVALEELETTLMCKQYPGLYLLGEIVDITGICGGYNLQWAFASAYNAVMRGLVG